jgi:molybdate transport system ATP-binding protein
MILEFTATLAARRFDLSFTVDEGETIAILGPNGAGKSTLLALLSGLLRADDGRAELAGTTLFDRDGSLPTHRRGVSLLAQEALLFPHLSVLENVAFGPRSAGVPRTAARSTAQRWLREVDATEFAARRPGQLSGGQAQRIAVARALATDPRLLLLDEPMFALDVTVVPAIRGMLRRVLADRTAIVVTHDVIDAYTLADRVIVMDGGRIVDSGPTREVLERPRTAFAAALVGLNLLDDGSLVAPGAILVSTARPAGDHVVEGTVESIETRGDLVRVRVGELAADVTPAVLADLGLVPGDHAWLSF